METLKVILVIGLCFTSLGWIILAVVQFHKWRDKNNDRLQ